MSLWDKLHGTFRSSDIAPEEITIGVPAYQNPEDVTLAKILPLPFEKQKNDWELPEADHAAKQLNES